MTATAEQLLTGVQTRETVEGESSIVIDERRIAVRQKESFFAVLRPMGQESAHRCAIGDIGEGGLFVRVPLSYGLSVGQRCEVLFSASDDSVSKPCPTDEPCYATIVRTEVLIEGSMRSLGAGLRFDQPLFL